MNVRQREAGVRHRWCLTPLVSDTVFVAALLASASVAHAQNALLDAAKAGDTARALAAIDEGADVRATAPDTPPLSR